MTFKSTIIIINILLISCTEIINYRNGNKKQSDCSDKIDTKDSYPSIAELYKNNPYEFDTFLKRGYYLHFEYFIKNEDKIPKMALVIKFDDKIIDTLNILGYGASHRELGYVGADFNNTFVFVTSFGLGNPHEIQLIEKKTGEIIKKGYWVDANEKEEVLLYFTNTDNNTDSLKLFDIKHNKEMTVTDFDNSKCAKNCIEGVRGCLKIDSVSTDFIFLKSEFSKEQIRKTYRR